MAAGRRGRNGADAGHQLRTRTGIALGGSFMDYLTATSLECPSWEMGQTVTTCPHHR